VISEKCAKLHSPRQLVQFWHIFQISLVDVVLIINCTPSRVITYTNYILSYTLYIAACTQLHLTQAAQSQNEWSCRCCGFLRVFINKFHIQSTKTILKTCFNYSKKYILTIKYSWHNSIIPLHSFNYTMTSFRAVDVTFSVAYTLCAHYIYII
jgi:hypothetical protein